jgi:hypothetical protein
MRLSCFQTFIGPARFYRRIRSQTTILFAFLQRLRLLRSQYRPTALRSARRRPQLQDSFWKARRRIMHARKPHHRRNRPRTTEVPAPLLVKVTSEHASRAANEDIAAAAREPIVNPLWMITVGLSAIFALLALLIASD